MRDPSLPRITSSRRQEVVVDLVVDLVAVEATSVEVEAVGTPTKAQRKGMMETAAASLQTSNLASKVR